MSVVARPATGLTGEGLARTVTWRSAILLAVGTALLVTVSLGPMAQELGNVSVLVWSGTAVIGALQCILITSLARRYPSRAGGTATYAHLALYPISPTLGGLSSWAYWFAWTPGIAVNLLLAGRYLDSVLKVSGSVVLALLFVLVLYVVNYFGLAISSRIYAVVGALAVLPLAAILIGVLVKPQQLHAGALVPLVVPEHPVVSGATLALVTKWSFVAAWSSYGAEIASTVIAEMRNARTMAGRAMGVSAITGVVAFTVVPILLLALAGADGLTQDPATVLLAPARQLFGPAGERVIALMLVAALLLGAQAFVIGSSRTIYQMARDGHLPRFFVRTNRYGVPIGSMTWDIVIIVAMLLIFGNNVVDVVASANVGYVAVFVLLPITFVILLRREGDSRRGVRRVGVWMLAVSLAAVNLTMLIFGGAQWGGKVVGTALVVLALIVPLRLLARRGAVPEPPAGAGSVATPESSRISRTGS